MTHWPHTLQLIGSRTLGGAERWFQRFNVALAAHSAPVTLGIRRGSALATLDYAGLTPHQLPFLSVWDPWSRRAVSRLIAQTRPEIVQTYMGRATRLTHLDQLPPAHRPRHVARLGGYYQLKPYRHADAWIGNTRGLCDWLIANGLPAARVQHIYNFVDPPRWRSANEINQLRAAWHIPAEAWALVTLGRFVPVKGHRDLLAAAAQLPAEIDGRRWYLILVGDGPLRADLTRQAEQAGIAAQVRWCGWQADPSAWLQLADLIVFPSLDAETLGNVILEAWAWQRPLVTTPFRGARELVRHGEDGWTVAGNDAKLFARAIELVLKDAALRAGLVNNGARRIEREFTRAVIMEQYRAYYNQLIGG
ncbi:glycosyltransferase [Thiospirillum jenense]|uniref:Glycosyltransferase n=1 Tax=Thiospirillum jenense TaxID=1653858 RepID=A0A839HDQ5_9GAMM|nr:glycosyltransferase [Thiospirillum jenense]MBB1127013.1 glycosyltransferase [Thiospirillum jenense]